MRLPNLYRPEDESVAHPPGRIIQRSPVLRLLCVHAHMIDAEAFEGIHKHIQHLNFEKNHCWSS